MELWRRTALVWPLGMFLATPVGAQNHALHDGAGQDQSHAPSFSVCNAATCDTFVDVTISGAIPTPPPVPGRLDVSVRYDGKSLSCTMRFGGWARPWCGTPVLAQVRLTAVARDAGVLAVKLIDAAPQAFDLELRDERGRSMTYRIVPGYRVAQPNGPRCEPVCLTASVAFER